jgi:hypothetical protein
MEQKQKKNLIYGVKKVFSFIAHPPPSSLHNPISRQYNNNKIEGRKLS